MRFRLTDEELTAIEKGVYYWNSIEDRESVDQVALDCVQTALNVTPELIQGYRLAAQSKQAQDAIEANLALLENLSPGDLVGVECDAMLEFMGLNGDGEWLSFNSPTGLQWVRRSWMQSAISGGVIVIPQSL